MQPADVARENRSRRTATRRGFKLTKTRTRDPLAPDYGWTIRRGDEILAGPLPTIAEVETELDRLAQEQRAAFDELQARTAARRTTT